MIQDLFSVIDSIITNDTPERHTYYQLKFFILGAEPTIQAKLQCCIRELKSRRISLENIQREIEDLKDQNTLLGIELEETMLEEEPEFEISNDVRTSQFEVEKAIRIRGLKRKQRMNERNIGELQRKFKFIMEECEFFAEAFQDLEKEEKLKPWDNLAVQQEYWDAKLGRELKLKLLLGHPLDGELVKAIEELHDGSETKNQIIQLINKQQEFHEKHGIPTLQAKFDVPKGGAGS